MKRINWIDELKGFILILVCLGHTHISIPFMGGDVLTICQAFRMSTFFFLSGILFSTRRYTTINSYIMSKTKVLLIPYVLLALLFSFLDPRLYDLSLMERQSYLNPYCLALDIHSNSDFLIMELISIFYHGVPITGGPLWFVLTLFFVSVLFFIIHHMLKGNAKGIIIYAVFCLITGWLLNLYNLILPFGFSTVFTASFFFAFGYLAKRIIKYMTGMSKIKLGTIIIFLSPIYLYAINLNGAISLMNNEVGNNFFGYITSTVTGIFVIVSIFILFDKLVCKCVLQGILKNIARNALIVLPVHYWAIKCCGIFLHPISNEDYFPWLVTLIMIIVTALAIPLFRTRFYKLLGKEKISFKESLSIK
ncbi:acyltransferase family protein [Bacteroides caecicola]|uniref:acyltransferase family protein n=1 Tax=Bacteroides caecicola TaxID=1462569 RepID=UPI00201180F7|nr:acyltransferase [Bacteroides caecicola]MCL1624645.1 acyltransferase [Bacteroides caecicola]